MLTYVLVIAVATFSEAVNVNLDKFELCQKDQLPVMFQMKLKNEGKKQYIEEGFMDSKIDLNDDVLNTITIYSYVDNKWNYIISKNDTICIMVESIMGEFAKNLEKSAGITSGCPHKKGKYSVKDYLIDFSTFKYTEFPPGRVKLRSELHPKADETKMLGCYEAEFTLAE